MPEKSESKTADIKADNDKSELEIRGNDGPPNGSGEYGASRDNGAREHTGVDIVKEPGAPVQSLTGGTVVERNSQTYPGNDKYNTVTIKDPAGNFIRYSYVYPSVNRGDRISAGQTIGRDQNRASESPGMTNHTHIEVRDASTRNSDSTIRAERDFGQHIDPVKYLQEHYGYTFK